MKPRPAQAYCKRCEDLFCYFYFKSARKYCGRCAELERLEQREFDKIWRRLNRIRAEAIA